MSRINDVLNGAFNGSRFYNSILKGTAVPEDKKETAKPTTSNYGGYAWVSAPPINQLNFIQFESPPAQKSAAPEEKWALPTKKPGEAKQTAKEWTFIEPKHPTKPDQSKQVVFFDAETERMLDDAEVPTQQMDDATREAQVEQIAEELKQEEKNESQISFAKSTLEMLSGDQDDIVARYLTKLVKKLETAKKNELAEKLLLQIDFEENGTVINTPALKAAVKEAQRAL